MKKKLVLILLILVFVGLYLYFNSKRNNVFINPTQNDKMAYYVDDGNGGYNKQNTIPIGNYIINEEKSKCLAGGTISEYNSTQGTIRYSVKGSDRCSVYFDVKLHVTLDMGTVAISTGGTENVTMSLRSDTLAYKLLTDNNTTYSVTINSGLVKDTLYGNMFRYQSNADRTCTQERINACTTDGACGNTSCVKYRSNYFNIEDNTNNYVCFGYSNASECTGSNKDDYLYRIIGIDKDTKEVQVIKATGIKEGLTTTFAYHNATGLYTYWGAGMPYTQADIAKRLNGTHTTLSNIFVNSTQYPYMTEDSNWYNKISRHNWKSGWSYNLEMNGGDNAYIVESGFATTSLMKIGLLNASDVFYGLTEGISYSNNTGAWIYSSVNLEWIAPRENSDEAYLIGNNMFDDFGVFIGSDVDDCREIRPTFFLNSDIIYVSGNGMKNNPFIVE